MSSIKVVDVNNEEAKQEPTTEQIEETQAEEPHEEIQQETKQEVVNEVVNQKETEQEALNNNSKTARLKDKKITCPKCSKCMLLRSYRYKHEFNCRGNLEDRVIKPKSKPMPKPKVQPVQQTVQEPVQQTVQEQVQQPAQPIQNQIIQPSNPLTNMAHHYQLLQQQFIQQKKEKYNNLCQNMFAPKSKKR